MTHNYPSLQDMGITNPEEITRYSLQTLNNIDILRIVYKRQKGSLFPSSKKFKFPRTKRLLTNDHGDSETSEISPFLSKVIDELHKIVELKHTAEEQKEIILDEIKRLEEEVHSRVSYIQSLVNKLD